MLDVETKTLWSHILGRAMDGPLKGTTLEIVPGEMTTWKSWKKRFPQTTVVKLSPTRFAHYNREFYKRPEQFVYGAVIDGQPHHRPWAPLMKQSVQNLRAGKRAVLAVTDAESTSVRLFDRTLDGKTLSFKPAEQGAAGPLIDDTTGSHWNHRGEAVAGPWRGKSLPPVVGLVSFASAWKRFHPDSEPFAEPSPPGN